MCIYVYVYYNSYIINLELWFVGGVKIQLQRRKVLGGKKVPNYEKFGFLVLVRNFGQVYQAISCVLGGKM